MKASGLSELHAVVAVATRRSFRGAASALGVSPSAVSHSVSALEDRLKVRLFSRTTRSVSLTPAGERFLSKVGPALDALGEALESMNEDGDEPVGVLRLNTSEMAARQVLEPLILAYARQYPGVAVDIVTDGRLVDIVAERFDAGIRVFETLPLDMVAVPIGGEQRHIVVGAPSYFEGRSAPKSPKDLLKHTCLRFRLPSGKLYKWEFSKGGRRSTVDVQGPLTFDSSALTLKAATQGVGLAYVYAWSARQELASGALVEVLSEWTPPYRGLHLYYPRQRRSTAALRALIEMIRRMPAGAV